MSSRYGRRGAPPSRRSRGLLAGFYVPRRRACPDSGSFATIFGVAAIAAFCVSASWALLPVIMLVLILMTAGVVAALGRVLDE